MLPFLIGAAGVMVTASAVGWIYDKMTEEEEEYHEKLRDIAAGEIERKKKTEERIFFERKDVFLKAAADYLKRCLDATDDMKKLKQSIEDVLLDKNSTRYLRSACITAIRDIELAFARQESYIRYIAHYRRVLEDLEKKKSFRKIEDIAPPSYFLPDDYFYKGQTLILTLEDIERYRYGGPPYGLRLRKNFAEGDIPDTKEFPVFIEIYWTPEDNKENEGIYFFSLVKGELIVNYFNEEMYIPFPVTCIKDYGKYVEVFYKKQIKGKVPRKNKLTPLRQYRPGTEFMVYALEWDFLLSKNTFSEIIPEDAFDLVGAVSVIIDSKKISKEKIESIDTGNIVFLPDDDISSGCFIIRSGEDDYKAKLSPSKKPTCIEIIEIMEKKSSSLVMVSMNMTINVIPKEGYDPDFELNAEEVIHDFYRRLSEEFMYQHQIKSMGAETDPELEFIPKWKAMVQYKIQNNQHEILFEGKYDTYHFDKLFNFIIKDEEEFQKVKSKLKLFVNVKENEKAGIKQDYEMWIPIKSTAVSDSGENSEFQLQSIGYIDDYTVIKNKPHNDELHLKIKPFSNYESENLVCEDRPYFEIRKKNWLIPYYQQMSALIRFENSEMTNPDLKRIIVAPNLSWNSVIESENTITDFQNDLLTINQKRTVQNAVNAERAYLIQGPPGTGKTTVIKEIVYQTLKTNPSANILIVAQQNVAVDNALEGIFNANRTAWFLDANPDRKSIVRCGREEKIDSEIVRSFTIETWYEKYKNEVKRVHSKDTYHPNLKEIWWNSINKEKLSKVDSELLQILLKKHQIIGATCVGLASKKIGLDLLEFDLTIIDEAGRATPPELLIPIIRSKKVIMIGDHFQLPPMVNLDEDEMDELGVDKEFTEMSLFERVFSMSKGAKSVLNEQFRMPNSIGRLISEIFYKGIEPRLINGRDKSPTDKFLINREISWINIKGIEKMEGTSRYNEQEIESVLELIKELDELAKQKDVQKSVAVITPYGAHKRRIKAKIQKIEGEIEKLDIKIDTIDSFQGKEADIVIYSTVRTFGNTVFLSDKRRLNVAVSRTRENLYFIGNKEFMRESKPKKAGGEPTNYFKEIIDYIDSLSLN